MNHTQETGRAGYTLKIIGPDMQYHKNGTILKDSFNFSINMEVISKKKEIRVGKCESIRIFEVIKKKIMIKH